jgi:class 3 adenylate cyclase
MGERACPACGAANQDGAKFCNQCAAPLGDAAAETSPATRGERRQITVLFSDASGYTSIAEHLDPEELRDIMGMVYAKATATVAKYGGRIDKLMGDAILAVFGDPVAHEDDAERAVRTALELHQAVEAMRTEIEAKAGQSFAMHSGINSGVVVSGDLDDRASGPLGDMVNVAARLQALAEPGEILVGPETRSLLHGTFELEDLGERELRGRRDAVRVCRVTGVANEREAPSRRASSFIGRHEELGVLLGAVDRVRDGESTLITICAEAGAGKTRLLTELRRRVDTDVQFLEGRAYPYSGNIPYSPIIDMISRSIGIDERDSPQQVLGKLTAMVAALVPGNELAMATLAHLYGLAPADAAPDLEAFRANLLATLTALLDAFAGRAPTVVVLQDLHWVDPSTADLMRELAQTVQAPRVTVYNFRPGFALGVSGERQLRLSELSQRQIREQLSSLLDDRDPPEELTALVASRTDGNPFFVEEIVNSLIETGVLVRNGAGWALSQRLDEHLVPSTIRGLIAARIDNLDANRRRVLREVSVVGREFLYRLARTVTATPDDLDPSLAELAAADLIREKAKDPDLEYIFKHALTQEVAYEGLLRKERQALHERVGAAIEAHLGDRSGEFAETLAYHYERSGNVPKAVDHLMRAGRRALDRYALAEAAAHYRAAYAVLTGPDAAGVDPASRDRMLLEVILEWAHLLYYTGELNELHKLQEAHAELPGRVGDDRLRARWLGWSGHSIWMHLADHPRSIALLDEAYELGRRCGDATSQAYALTWLMWSLVPGGYTDRAIATWPLLEPLLVAVEDPHDRRYLTIKGICGRAVASAAHGDWASARRDCRELAEIGARTGNRRAVAMSHLPLSGIAISLNDHDRAVAEANAVIDTGVDPIYEFSGKMWRAAAETFLGDPHEAKRLIDRFRPEVERVEVALMTLTCDGFGAAAALGAGDLSQGIHGVLESRERYASMAYVNMVNAIDLFLGTMYARIATGEVKGSLSSALRNPSFVFKHVRGAAKRGREILEALDRALEERGYLGNRPAVLFELGKLAKHDKRRDDARAQLERVCALVADEPDSPIMRDARALLAGL